MKRRPMSRGAFAGTKRRARLMAEEDRRTSTVNRRMEDVLTLSGQIRSQEQLDAILDTVEGGPEMREAVKKLLVPMTVIGRIAKVRE